MTDEPRLIDDVNELLQLIQLKDVYFLEVAGQRRALEEGDALGLRFETVQTRPTAEGIEARFIASFVTEELRAKVDIVSAYGFTEPPIQIGPAAIRDFLEKIAIFAIWPYLREAIASICTRLRLDVVNLKVIIQGEFELGEQEFRDV